MATTRQKAAARKNITQAIKAAKRPKNSRSALGEEGAKAAARNRGSGHRAA